MEKREDVLFEALEINENEIQHWQAFVAENETAIKNMEFFHMKLTASVMVPFGGKAFFFGSLLHTNEILIAHFQNYFSQSSSYTATRICKHRVNNAKKRLIQLETERDLFQNKLREPRLHGAVPKICEHEIIEIYDEEKEQEWRKQHRQRTKEAKLVEKHEREAMLDKCSNHDSNRILENENSIEDLDEELAELENEYINGTKELLNRLISGELKLPPPKKRVPHSITRNAVKQEVNKIQKDNLSDKIIITEMLNHIKTAATDDENDSDISISEVPEEIGLIQEQARFLAKKDRFVFFQDQLHILDQKLANVSINNKKELEEKMHMFKIKDYLEELLEETSIDLKLKPKKEKELDVDTTRKKPTNRRISFAQNNQMLEFRKNETVKQMKPKVLLKKSALKRDILRLDERKLINEQHRETDELIYKKPVDKIKTILEKIEENIKNNSSEDLDLVNKIIDSSVRCSQTLHIHLKHSTSFRSCSSFVKKEIPKTPADFYNLFNTPEIIDKAKNADIDFYLRESDRERGYVDVRSEFLKPVKKLSREMKSISILKKKIEVEHETINPKTNEEDRKRDNEEENSASYNKVMIDVFENTLEPDTLPEEIYMNMHAPKKRISRFKQMRNEQNISSF